MRGKIAVSVEHVFRAFSSGMALNDVSVCFPAGSLTAVIGPSGAGKSTLLRCMNGMERISSGRVFVGGIDMASAGRAQRRAAQRSIGTIWQDFCLVEQCSALDNVLNGALAEMNFFSVLFGLFGRKRRQRALELLKRVGLENRIFQAAALLSGGEKQRCAIARALMQGCQVLLADEPVSSLDPVHARSVLALLKQLSRKNGVTVIMNSHNVEQARLYADFIVGLRAGRVVLCTTPAQLTQTALSSVYGDEAV